MIMHTWDIYEVRGQREVCQGVVEGPSRRTKLPDWWLLKLSSSRLAIGLTIRRLSSESLKIKADYRTFNYVYIKFIKALRRRGRQVS